MEIQLSKKSFINEIRPVRTSWHRQKTSEVLLYYQEIFSNGVEATRCLSCNKIHIFSSGTIELKTRASTYEFRDKNRQIKIDLSCTLQSSKCGMLRQKHKKGARASHIMERRKKLSFSTVDSPRFAMFILSLGSQFSVPFRCTLSAGFSIMSTKRIQR